MTADRITACGAEDFDEILAVINDGATAYRGVIPEDRWHDPYMSAKELRSEIDAGISFDAVRRGDSGSLEAVMGVQPVEDVVLIRHAYVRTDRQRRGLGSALLQRHLGRNERPVLIGTWAAATWAIDFYRRHGFTPLPRHESARLLRRYWNVPERQIETSVVLADARWIERGHGSGTS